MFYFECLGDKVEFWQSSHKCKCTTDLFYAESDLAQLSFKGNHLGTRS